MILKRVFKKTNDKLWFKLIKIKNENVKYVKDNGILKGLI